MVSNPVLLPAGTQTLQPNQRMKNSGEHASRGQCSAPCTHSPKHLQPRVACSQLCGGFSRTKHIFWKQDRIFVSPQKRRAAPPAPQFSSFLCYSQPQTKPLLTQANPSSRSAERVLKQEAGQTGRPPHCKPGIRNPTAHLLRPFIPWHDSSILSMYFILFDSLHSSLQPTLSAPLSDVSNRS